MSKSDSREAVGPCARCGKPIEGHSLEDARVCGAVLIDRDQQRRLAK